MTSVDTPVGPRQRNGVTDGTPPPAVSIRVVDPGQEKNWDALVLSHPGSSFFHSAAWAKVLMETYQFRPLYLAAIEGERLLALLPLLEASSWLAGTRGVSLPFTDECPPLTSDRVSGPRLLEEVMALGRQRKWKYWEGRGGLESFGNPMESLSFHGHRLSLDKSKDALFGQLDSSVRRAIRKGERCGVKVEISSTRDAIQRYYGLHCRTRQKHGLPPQPFSFFERIYDQVLARGLGFVSLATVADQPVAAAVYFHLGTRAIYKFGASDERRQELRGSNLVMWEAIQWLARRGFTELSFGRTSLGNEGLRKFKLGWGAAEHRISCVKYDFDRQQFVQDSDKTSGWHNRVFGLMPLPLARLAGQVLYRHLT